MPGHSNFVISVAFSPNGRILASGSFDETVKMWDVENGQELTALVGMYVCEKMNVFDMRGISFICA